MGSIIRGAIVYVVLLVRHIARWAQTHRDTTAGCKDVFVYFKHEEAARARSSPDSCSRRWAAVSRAGGVW